ISNVGLIGTEATVGALYIYGLKNHNEHAHEAGFLETESFVDSYAMKELVNVISGISGRLRPEEGNGHGDFFVNHSFDSSFPSGHAMLTWSMASVLADEYPSGHTLGDCGGSELFGLKEIRLILSNVLGPKLVGRAMKIFREVADDADVAF